MNTVEHVQPKPVGYEAVANYIAKLVIKLVAYVIKFEQKL